MLKKNEDTFNASVNLTKRMANLKRNLERNLHSSGEKNDPDLPICRHRPALGGPDHSSGGTCRVVVIVPHWEVRIMQVARRMIWTSRFVVIALHWEVQIIPVARRMIWTSRFVVIAPHWEVRIIPVARRMIWTSCFVVIVPH